jgi:isocitrate dehydrogenase
MALDPISGASQRVLMPPSKKAYGGRRKIAWMEVFAGEKSFTRYNTWLPDETLEPSASSSWASKAR